MRRKKIDRTYMEKRNRLVKKAEKYADGVCGAPPDFGVLKQAWSDRWNKVFHGKMDRLAAGLVA